MVSSPKIGKNKSNCMDYILFESNYITQKDITMETEKTKHKTMVETRGMVKWDTEGLGYESLLSDIIIKYTLSCAIIYLSKLM